MTASNALLCFALTFTALAALSDLRTSEIPNRLTLGAMTIGSLLQMAVSCWAERSGGQALSTGFVLSMAARVALGVLICGLVPYLLFLRNGMGGGDVKLLGAVGGTLGPVVGLEVQLYAFIAMLVFAPARLAYAGRLTQVLGNTAALLVNPLLPKQKKRVVSSELLSTLKFGPAVLAGMAVVCALHWRSP